MGNETSQCQNHLQIGLLNKPHYEKLSCNISFSKQTRFKRSLQNIEESEEKTSQCKSIVIDEENKQERSGKPLVKDYTYTGFATVLMKKGKYLTGQFVNGQITGEGILEKNGKVTFKGQFQKGKSNGFGHFILADKCFYIGNTFVNYQQSQDFYISLGNWQNSKQNGLGIYYSFGGIESGIWKDNKLIQEISMKNIEFPSNVEHLLIDPHKLPIRINFTDANNETKKNN